MSQLTDKEFLTWLRDRLVNVYGENEGTDFVLRLEGIISSCSEPKTTAPQCPQCGSYRLTCPGGHAWNVPTPKPSLDSPPICPIHNQKMVLSFYDRPGSAPGNGWVCNSCIAARQDATIMNWMNPNEI